jgi:hypothetical protein
MSLRERTRPVGTIEPCLASPAKTAPSGPDWLHESSMTVFAFHRDSAGVRLITRARFREELEDDGRAFALPETGKKR